jgi:hypothetical protein
MQNLKLDQQELRDLRELVAGQVVVNQSNPTAWYWMELGQRISRLIQE